MCEYSDSELESATAVQILNFSPYFVALFTCHVAVFNSHLRQKSAQTVVSSYFRPVWNTGYHKNSNENLLFCIGIQIGIGEQSKF